MTSTCLHGIVTFTPSNVLRVGAVFLQLTLIPGVSARSDTNAKATTGNDGKARQKQSESQNESENESEGDRKSKALPQRFPSLSRACLLHRDSERGWGTTGRLLLETSRPEAGVVLSSPTSN